MAKRDIVVIGGSAGAVAALRRLVASIPAASQAALLVVTHMAPDAPTTLAPILGAIGTLPAIEAAEGAPVAPGTITVAVRDRHLLLTAGRPVNSAQFTARGAVRLGAGPREHLARPAIDALFRSAAIAFGPRVIGVLLSGRLDDGAAGLAAVVRCGGLALVQDPADAEAADMPRAGLAAVEPDVCADAASLGRLIGEFSQSEAPIQGPPPADLVEQDAIAAGLPSRRQEKRLALALAALEARLPLLRALVAEDWRCGRSAAARVAEDRMAEWEGTAAILRAALAREAGAPPARRRVADGAA